jgi:hypothetical protein
MLLHLSHIQLFIGSIYANKLSINSDHITGKTFRKRNQKYIEKMLSQKNAYNYGR